MASAHALTGLMKWLGRDAWREPFNDLIGRHLGPPCARAGIEMRELGATLGDHQASVLWGCVFEDFLASDLDDGGNIIDDYLKRRGWKESVHNKRYMTSLRSSVMSLYEISDIIRDESFLARDLIRGGEPVRVSEKSGTRTLKQWDRLAARVVRVGSKFEMAGGALPFSHDLGEMVLEGFAAFKKAMRAEFRKRAGTTGGDAVGAEIDQSSLDTDVLREAAFLFTTLWLDDILEQTLHPKLPRMCNSEGDEIVWTTARYRLKPATDAKAVTLALAQILSLRPEGDAFWNWIDIEGSARTKRPADAQTFVSTLEDGSAVLGTLELEDGALVLETNSRRRSERGRALIEPVLGTLVGKPAIEARTVAELMASRTAEKSGTLSSGLSPDEERAIIRENLDSHYRALLDEPVPMLGNVSPRKAAKTKTGREKLVGWLKLLENNSAGHDTSSPMAEYDMRWMWDELGVADLRC